MGTDYFFMVSAGYIFLTAAIIAFEIRRTRASGPDVVSVFMALFVLQCCLPGVVIYACLPLAGREHPTDNAAFDHIYNATDLPDGLLILGLTACFVFFFYAFTALGGTLLRRLRPTGSATPALLLCGSPWLLSAVLACGLGITLVSFYFMGATWVERYANLILLRAYSDEVDRTTLNAYAFELTQTWGWLSIVALFVIYESRGRGPLWYATLCSALLFAILGVSRRALFIPMLLVYLTYVLFNGRWRLKWLLASALPVLVWVAFGKELLAVVAYGGNVGEVAARYDTLASAFLRTASEVGITVTESIGTINLMDLAPRFGVDHLLSVMRRVPVGWFGGDLGLPVRIVRLSTEAFATPEDQDIPPGFLGQMWLDFRVIGPVVWGFIFAAQVSVVQSLFAATVRTRQATAAFVLATFVVALPINSGSFDFTFSVDIIAVMVFLLLTFKFVQVRLVKRTYPKKYYPAPGAGCTSTQSNRG